MNSKLSNDINIDYTQGYHINPFCQNNGNLSNNVQVSNKNFAALGSNLVYSIHFYFFISALYEFNFQL